MNLRYYVLIDSIVKSTLCAGHTFSTT